jgi:hypothetical protein
MLPIGDDPGGNLFLINAGSSGEHGKIYFWDHNEEADLEKQPYYKNIYFIAHSFADFIDRLA